MKYVRSLLPCVLVFVVGAANAAEQMDVKLLLQRLQEIEAEQARTQRELVEIRSQLEAAGIKPDEGTPTLAEQTVPPPQPKELGRTEYVPDRLMTTLAGDSRFVLRSSDGDAELGIDGLLNFRAEYNYRSDDGSGSSEHDSGFEITGTRINFRGHVLGEYGYWARLQADEFGSDPVFDALIGSYKLNDKTTIALGQLPNFMTREQGLMVEKIQAVEASSTNNVFDAFAYKGVAFGYNEPTYAIRGVLHDGYRSFANGYDEIDEGPSADWAFAGQWVATVIGDGGDWDRFDNITSRPGSDFAWQVNTAFNAQGNPDIYLGILESSFEGDGWNFYSSAYYRDSDEEFDGVGGEDLGFVLQGGLWVASHFEIYSRYDFTRPDSDRPDEGDGFRTLMGGLTYYPRPETDNIRFQGELMYMFDPEAESLVQPGTLTSVRASPDGGQWVFRTQASLRW